MSLDFGNGHPVRFWVAISFLDEQRCGGEGGDWISVGWYPVEPFTSVTVYRGDISDVNRFWYYYAESDDGRKWTGPFRSQISRPGPFRHCDGIGVSTAEWVGFREIDVGDEDGLLIVPG